jgi:hypothetical protein
VGSLVNTLTLYQHTDLRLEAFARQLSEEWDVSIFVDFIIAQNLCLQVGEGVGGWGEGWVDGLHCQTIKDGL